MREGTPVGILAYLISVINICLSQHIAVRTQYASAHNISGLCILPSVISAVLHFITPVDIKIHQVDNQTDKNEYKRIRDEHIGSRTSALFLPPLFFSLLFSHYFSFGFLSGGSRFFRYERFIAGITFGVRVFLYRSAAHDILNITPDFGLRCIISESFSSQSLLLHLREEYTVPV